MTASNRIKCLAFRPLSIKIAPGPNQDGQLDPRRWVLTLSQDCSHDIFLARRRALLRRLANCTIRSTSLRSFTRAAIRWFGKPAR